MRRALCSRAARAALLTATIALVGAIPSFASSSTHGAVAVAATTVVHAKVARTGSYLVVVEVQAVPSYETVSIYAGSQSQTNIALPENQPTSYAFYMHLSHKRYTVRLVPTGPKVNFTVSSARQTLSSSAGDTGPPPSVSGATGSTGPADEGVVPGVHVFGPSSPPYRTLAWSDEFNGPAGTPPNPAVWGDDLEGGCGPGSLSTDTADPANAELDGKGNLAINVIAGPGGYTSAQLDSENLFSFEYGRLAARIELPASSGLCSAFWAVGDSTAQPCFPQCGEIDAMEAISEFPNRVFATLHGPVDGSANFQQTSAYVNATTPLTGGFHTYAVTWTPTKITWTLDGVPYATESPQSLPPSAQWAFSGHPFHVILSVAVGGWPGPPAAGTLFPATMKVAWVRLYN